MPSLYPRSRKRARFSALVGTALAGIARPEGTSVKAAEKKKLGPAIGPAIGAMSVGFFASRSAEMEFRGAAGIECR